MTTKNNILNKVLVTCFCSSAACGAAWCYDIWSGCEACGLANLNQAACWWTLCAPICHQCKLGDTHDAADRCGKCFKYCIYSLALDLVSPCDACYNCIFYNIDNCTEGVSGFRDVLKHTRWIGGKIGTALELTTSNEPQATYDTFKP